MATSIKECILLLLQEQPELQMAVESVRKIISKNPQDSVVNDEAENLEKIDEVLNALVLENVVLIEDGVVKLVDLLAAKNKNKKRKAAQHPQRNDESDSEEEDNYIYNVLKQNNNVVNMYQAPTTPGKGGGRWTEEQEAELLRVVPENMCENNGKMVPNWSIITKLVGRDYKACSTKYRSKTSDGHAFHKVGNFTADEDSAIRDALSGGEHEMSEDVWQTLEEVLNREIKSIKLRWKTLQQDDRGGKSNRRLYWSAEMDDRLRASHAAHNQNWKLVAEDVGFGTTPQSCADRWRRNVDPAVAEQKGKPWTPEDIQRLTELVAQHKRVHNHKECTNWAHVSAEMNRTRTDCSNKWNLMSESLKGNSSFTDVDDDLIFRRVREFEGLGT
eukprot:gene30627-37871_t